MSRVGTRRVRKRSFQQLVIVGYEQLIKCISTSRSTKFQEYDPAHASNPFLLPGFLSFGTSRAHEDDTSANNPKVGAPWHPQWRYATRSCHDLIVNLHLPSSLHIYQQDMQLLSKHVCSSARQRWNWNLL
ncbi:uncharacterized protein EI90DRAFT_2290882 [Cantharellus anzutake]|uniref:uncharacterized protein n=1 Tax=Cantharellus anzutake TaxID=1750568 RepID=UPI001904FB91|nr:uncharacterized protein EI90DRAFT_2290882 [Cantharellus anzutake]KAF8339839.1 hypothetical protein EI90DRAFT_2290882 [Cantharellus anzutake]